MAAKPPPPKAPPGAGSSLGAPNQTLYVSNLNDKLQKEDLRRSLYMLFSTYGPVLDIVALKTPKMRGQAHIVFRDIQASTQALRSLQGFEFFGKDIKIQYGKGKSDAIAKLDGTFRIPVTAAAAGQSTELQQSIFNAPPPAAAGTSVKAPTGDVAMADGDAGPHGQKRTRDEEEEDASMEEDEDEAMAMDESDSD